MPLISKNCTRCHTTRTIDKFIRPAFNEGGQHFPAKEMRTCADCLDEDHEQDVDLNWEFAEEDIYTCIVCADEYVVYQSFISTTVCPQCTAAQVQV